MTTHQSLSLNEIMANDPPRDRILLEVLKKLQNAKSVEQILQAGVEIAYQSLGCDRAVVYSLESDSYCKITAEAVTPGYTQTIGTTIKDPCFEAGYIDKYRRGRVRAIADIYQSGINPCHIENLEKIEVKSNLVVPIIRLDNSLYGLLVMHQCSRKREWQQFEVELVLQISSWLIEAISQQQINSDLELRVESFKQAREVITQATRKLYRMQTSLEVLQQGVEQAKEIINCDRVVIYSLQNKNLGTIVAEATTPALAPILGNVIKDPCFEYRYLEQYQQGRVRAITNIYEAGMTNCYVENLAQIGVRSNLVAPINCDNGKIYGLLVAHQCFSFKDWQPIEIEHFVDIAFHTGLSLSKAKIQEQSHTIASDLEQLKELKAGISLAKSKIAQIKQPLHNTSRILIEASNLYKLLEREIEQINRNSSTQTKKDTKLIQIIARKLMVITAKLKNPLSVVNSSSKEANEILEEAIANLDGNESNLTEI